MNGSAYIHEFVDIIGHHRANYMHHVTANWSPVAQEERDQRCFGVFAVLGSTGRWPQVCNLWEHSSWSGLAEPALPDVPAISEKIPGFSGDLWIALFGVAGTQPEVIDTLYQATARVMQKPSVQKKLLDQGVELAFDTPAQLTTRLNQDIIKWRDIVNSSGARVD